MDKGTLEVRIRYRCHTHREDERRVAFEYLDNRHRLKVVWLRCKITLLFDFALIDRLNRPDGNTLEAIVHAAFWPESGRRNQPVVFCFGN